jgi:hypothetical protein
MFVNKKQSGRHAAFKEPRRRDGGCASYGGFNISGMDSKAGGADYRLLFMQANSVAEK